MKITVFGAGYVGLVQSAILSDVGHHVMCIDVNGDKLMRIARGEIPFYEPGLQGLVSRNLAAGRLSLSTEANEGIEHSDIIFIAVGTPSDEDGSADLRHVMAVAQVIGDHMQRSKVVIMKSTVPVGTSKKVAETIATALAERGTTNIGYDVVSNPEFLKEGTAVEDCLRPDRIIIGTENLSSQMLLRELYEPFNRNHEKIIVMDARSAELTKYAANCMLATKISFMNELSVIAEKTGADIEMVRKGIGADPRIGHHFIYAGAGYGGSCLPKDVRALIATAEDLGIKPALLKAVESRNEQQKLKVFKDICDHFRHDISGKTFAIWGLSFKPNTDDMREAPSRVVMEALWSLGARVQAYDPEAMGEAQRIYGNRTDMTLCGTPESTLNNADALIIMTEWQCFKSPDFDYIKSQLKNAVIFDGRNLYNKSVLKSKGIQYYGIGRP